MVIYESQFEEEYSLQMHQEDTTTWKPSEVPHYMTSLDPREIPKVRHKIIGKKMGNQ